MNISVEIEKLGRFVNTNEILRFEDFETEYYSRKPNTKIRYLLYVLKLKCNNSEIEAYLEQLLKNYSIAELDDLEEHDSGFTILHFMIWELSHISLNSFELIINFGIDVNKQNEHGNTPLHFLCYGTTEHIRSVIGLFVKYGVDLNVLSCGLTTVLDETIADEELDEDLGIIIMTLMDFGAQINNPYPGSKVKVLEFIESYGLSIIKPAIKK